MLAYEAQQYKRDKIVYLAFFRLTLFAEGHAFVDGRRDPEGIKATLMCMIQQYLIGKTIRPKEYVAKLQTVEDISAEYLNHVLIMGFNKFAKSEIELKSMLALLGTKMSDAVTKMYDHKLLTECQANPEVMLGVKSLNDDIAMSEDIGPLE